MCCGSAKEKRVIYRSAENNEIVFHYDVRFEHTTHSDIVYIELNANNRPPPHAVYVKTEASLNEEELFLLQHQFVKSEHGQITDPSVFEHMFSSYIENHINLLSSKREKLIEIEAAFDPNMTSEDYDHIQRERIQMDEELSRQAYEILHYLKNIAQTKGLTFECWRSEKSGFSMISHGPIPGDKGEKFTHKFYIFKSSLVREELDD